MDNDGLSPQGLGCDSGCLRLLEDIHSTDRMLGRLCWKVVNCSTNADRLYNGRNGDFLMLYGEMPPPIELQSPISTHTQVSIRRTS